MNDERMKFPTEEMEALRQRVKDHRETAGPNRTPLTWKTLAGQMGSAESTLQAFAAGTYNGDNQKVAETVARWFRSMEAVDLFADDWVPGYQSTQTAREIQSNLTWAKRGKWITIIGDPGIGKTFALTDFTRRHTNVWMVTAETETSAPLPFLRELMDAMQVSASSGRTSYDLLVQVRRILMDRASPLLIIDEAQHLSERTLEQLRGLHDRTKCGIAVCGNHQVTLKVDGTRTANFAQRSSRVSTRPIYTLPKLDDVQALLAAWGVNDPREVEFLTAIAMRPGGGALRQMSMVLDKATLLAFGEKRQRNYGHIRDAAAEASIGAAA